MCVECARCGQRGNWLTCTPGTSHRAEEVYGYNPAELCRGCWRDLTHDPEVFDPTLRSQQFDFYYSASSGTSRKILEDHEASHTLVSYSTRQNGRIGGEDAHFVDSGGAPQSLISNEGYETPADEYLEYVAEVTTPNGLWALRDWPVTSSALDAFDASVEDFQSRTIEAHRELLSKANDYDIDAQPVAILQGETVADYLNHANRMAAAGTLTDYIAIGGIAPYGPHTQQQIILAVRELLPERFDIHGFGVNLGGLRMDGVVDALRSADSSRWLNYDGDNMEDSPFRRTTDNQLDYSKATYEYLDHLRTVNELIMESSWHMDAQPGQEGDAAWADDWVEFGTPTDPVEHLEPEMKQLVGNTSFVGMDGEHHASKSSDQQTLPV